MYSPSQKPHLERFIASALQYFNLLTGHDRLSGSCLYAAIASVLASADEAIPAVFLAGSAQWRRLPAHLDDGVTSTHFAFMWEPDHPDSRPLVRQLEELLRSGLLARSQGIRLKLPEVHCWGLWPDGDEIVDLTIGSLAEQCEKLGGGPWLCPQPPQYMIGTPNRDTRYTHSPEATTLMLRAALSCLRSVSPALMSRFAQHVVSSARLLQRDERLAS